MTVDILIKNNMLGLGIDQVLECLPSMCKALGSIPSTANNNNNNNSNLEKRMIYNSTFWCINIVKSI
jgi:hypothetical protein